MRWKKTEYVSTEDLKVSNVKLLSRIGNGVAGFVVGVTSAMVVLTLMSLPPVAYWMEYTFLNGVLFGVFAFLMSGGKNVGENK